jgi:hypothetical protein
MTNICDFSLLLDDQDSIYYSWLLLIDLVLEPIQAINLLIN